MRAIVLLLLCPVLLAAQVTSSTLSGTVADAGGAVVPNAKVTLRGEGNGFVRSVATNSDGLFSFPDLTPATFTLTIEAAGFKLYRQTGLEVSSNEQRSVGQIKLDVGQVTESVTVNAEAVAVDLSSGERAGTLTGEQLDEIALRGRDIFDAVSLMAGVVDTTDGRESPSPTSIGGISIMGGRTDQKNMTIDGVTNLDTGSNGSVHSMPSMDSVAEVKVLMAAYSAENGRNPFAISVITKGGTTQFHASAGYYLRNEDFNANDFFANEAGKPRAEYRYNIGSYTIGGPVILPKLHTVRNKLFFFWSQEFQRQVANYGVKEVTVPTAAMRAGDFSQAFTNTGSLIKVNDPLNNKAQFPGNVIPASRLTAVGKSILNVLPLPNFTDPNPVNKYQWNYYANVSEPYPRRTETARVDYSPRDNWQLYVSLSNNADSQAVPYSAGAAGWVAGAQNFPLVPISYQEPGRLATLHSANSLTSDTFNEASIAASQNTLTFAPATPDTVDRTKLGIAIPQRSPALNVLNSIPDMTFGGNVPNPANASMHNILPYFNQNTIFSAFDNVSRIHGKHNYKFGIYYEHTQKLQSAGAATRGTISFNTDGNNPLDSNNPFANALLGNYDAYSEATGAPQGNWKYINVEWFAQDTWHARRNLTFDYGIRFYADPPQYDSRLQLSSFSMQAYSPASAPVLLRPVKVNGANYAQDPTTGQLYSTGLVGDFAPGAGAINDGMVIGGKDGTPRGLFHLAPVAFAPRFGWAWDPVGDGRTSIRGGGGVYFDRIQGNPVMNLLQQPAFYTPTQYYGSFSDIAASAGTGFLSPSGTTYSLASEGHQQVVYNFNLQIQRQIDRNDVIQVGYAGSLGRHLLWDRNINAIPLGSTFLALNPQNRNPQNTSALPNNFLKPYQGYGNIFLYEFASNSNYHSLQVTFQHRIGRGFNLAANYTFAKALDTSDGYSSAVDPFLDPRARNYGPAGFDRRHVFSSNFYWTLPQPGRATGVRPLGWVTDGWALSGVVRMMTGAPVTPSYSLVNGIASPSGSPDDTARVEVIDPTAPLAQRFGPPPEPANQANVPWAIASTTPQLGNLGKNTMFGPGTNNWDLSMYRNLRLSERVNGQLRLESYNTFNHTQWSTFNTALQFNSQGAMVNPAFDTPNAARPPRRVQVAVRVWF